MTNKSIKFTFNCYFKEGLIYFLSIIYFVSLNLNYSINNLDSLGITEVLVKWSMITISIIYLSWEMQIKESQNTFLYLPNVWILIIHLLLLLGKYYQLLLVLKRSQKLASTVLIIKK
jgi:hypothetical protein